MAIGFQNGGERIVNKKISMDARKVLSLKKVTLSLSFCGVDTLSSLLKQYFKTFFWFRVEVHAFHGCHMYECFGFVYDVEIREYVEQSQ